METENESNKPNVTPMLITGKEALDIFNSIKGDTLREDYRVMKHGEDSDPSIAGKYSAQVLLSDGKWYWISEGNDNVCIFDNPKHCEEYIKHKHDEQLKVKGLTKNRLHRRRTF